MNRQMGYRGQIPFDTDFLYAQRFGYEAMGLLAADVLGVSNLIAGCGCVPTSPAGLAVKVAPGRIYSQQVLDATSWSDVNGVGGLAADTNADHMIVKQGLLRDTTTLSTGFTVPSTTGQSQNFLIQAAFSEVDSGSVTLPFFNAASPDVPWSGPNNSGGELPTYRADKLVLSVKAGVAATTGSQTTPAPDSGCVGLWVVTLANGDTTITSGKISQYGSAPFLTETLIQKISQATADSRYAQLASTVAAGQCRLGVVSATSLKLSPYNGNLLNINGSIQAVPSGGVSIANTGLSASTLYYAYAYMNGATMTLELSTTGHTTGNNGIEVKTGDATRTLVGMIRTQGSTPGQFVDTAAQSFVASWYNRKTKALTNGGGTAGGSTTAATFSDMFAGAHIEFLAWADEPVDLSMIVTAQVDASNRQANPALAIDSTSTASSGVTEITSTTLTSASMGGVSFSVAEGYHYATGLMAAGSGGTATFTGGTLYAKVRA